MSSSDVMDVDNEKQSNAQGSVGWGSRLRDSVRIGEDWDFFHSVRQKFKYTGDATFSGAELETFDVLGRRIAAFLNLLDTPKVPVNRSLLDKNTCISKLKTLSRRELGELLKGLGYVLTADATEKENWENELVKILTNKFFSPSSGSNSPQEMTQETGLWYPDAQKKATVAAWSVPYKGELHHELWMHIAKLMDPFNPRSYANMCPIIQSSGSGKSRLVDQLATEHFVIPICLRDPKLDGFPPSDSDVRRHLSFSFNKDQQPDHEITKIKIGAFFQALFEVAGSEVGVILRRNRFSENQYAAVSQEFRRLMTEGQSFQQHNIYRRSFFSEVLFRAEKIASEVEVEAKQAAHSSPGGSQKVEPISGTTSTQAPGSVFELPENYLEPFERNIQNACVALATKLESLLGAKKREDPLVIIAFDESGVLSESLGEAPPIFGLLSSRISKLSSKPSFFALFLSTTGHIAQFLSTRGDKNVSSRLATKEAVLNPAFTGCAFDAFPAGNIQMEEGTMTIQEAASEWCMFHLGRPLWATRVDEDLQKKASEDYTHTVIKFGMEFAMTKLLCRPRLPVPGLWHFESDEVIACLCHRLPIEFQSTAVFQHRIVENHMRICVRLDPKDETMFTISASEPVLAEAAFVAMRQQGFNPLPEMQRLLSGFSVHKGDRGELVALLLLLLARDHVVAAKNESMFLETGAVLESSKGGSKYPRHLGDPSLCDWNRVFSVPEFLRGLFGDIGGEVQHDIDELFKDTRMHFNHFLKVYQQDLLHSRYLTGFLMRGAALLCANGQKAVDAVIPFIFQDVIDRWFVGHILIQVKNDSKYKDKRKQKLFDCMDPIGANITTLMQDDPNPLPVIRIVFALASPRCSITARKVPVYLEDGRSYWAIDIWCAGISADILPHIVKSKDEVYWRSCVAFSQGWKSNYIPPGEDSARDYLQRMTPCLARDEQFWEYSPSILKKRGGPSGSRITVPPRPPKPEPKADDTPRPKKRKRVSSSDVKAIEMQSLSISDDEEEEEEDDDDDDDDEDDEGGDDDDDGTDSDNDSDI